MILHFVHDSIAWFFVMLLLTTEVFNFLGLGWYDVVVLPANECKWTFKEGDVAILSSPRPGSGLIQEYSYYLVSILDSKCFNFTNVNFCYVKQPDPSSAVPLL